MGWNPVNAVKSVAKKATDPNEYKKAWDAALEAAKKIDPSTAGHIALDVVGLVPVVGEAADLANAGWYLAEGNKSMAALSAAAAIPGLGYIAAGTKVGKAAITGVKAASNASGVTKTINAVKTSKAVTGVKNATTAVKNSKAASVAKTVANKTGVTKAVNGYAALNTKMTNGAAKLIDRGTDKISAGASTVSNAMRGTTGGTTTAARTASNTQSASNIPAAGGSASGVPVAVGARTASTGNPASASMGASGGGTAARGAGGGGTPPGSSATSAGNPGMPPIPRPRTSPEGMSASRTTAGSTAARGAGGAGGSGGTPPRASAGGADNFPRSPTDAEVAHVRATEFNGTTNGTVAVGRTSVEGMEDLVFTGASPTARQAAGKPSVDVESPNRPYQAPDKGHGFDRHAEEGVLNQFREAAEVVAADKGIELSEISGTLYVRQDNGNGVCGQCTAGLKNPGTSDGIFAQFVDDFPRVEVVVTSVGNPTGRLGTPEAIIGPRVMGDKEFGEVPFVTFEPDRPGLGRGRGPNWRQ